MHMILVPTPKVKVAIRSEVKIVSQQYSQITEANLTKFHRKIEHYEKVCRAQKLVPTPKVKVTIRSEVKLCLKLCCS